MSKKTIRIVGIVIALIGLFVAGYGVGLNGRPGQQDSGTAVTWIGIGITFVSIFAALFLTKNKGES